MDQPTAARIYNSILASRPALSGERLCYWRPLQYHANPTVNRVTHALVSRLGPGIVVQMRDMGNAVVETLMTTRAKNDSELARAMQIALTDDAARWEPFDFCSPSQVQAAASWLSARELHIIAQMVEHVGIPCSARLGDLPLIEEAADLIRDTFLPQFAVDDERVWRLADCLARQQFTTWFELVDEYADKLDGQEREDWLACCLVAVDSWDEYLHGSSEQPRVLNGEQTDQRGRRSVEDEDVAAGCAGGTTQRETDGGGAVGGDGAGIDIADDGIVSGTGAVGADGDHLDGSADGKLVV